MEYLLKRIEVSGNISLLNTCNWWILVGWQVPLKPLKILKEIYILVPFQETWGAVDDGCDMFNPGIGRPHMMVTMRAA